MRSQKKNKPKIVLTGGHAGTTALSVIEELTKKGEDSRVWGIYWIGVAHAFEGKRLRTLEHKTFSEMRVTYHPIVAGRFQRKWSVHTIPSLLKIPFGLVHAIYLLLKIRPRVVLSFGGFAGFPVVVAAYLLRVPVIIHEQTPAAGLANRASAFFADEVAIARNSSRKFFPSRKTILVGNPVMTSIAKVRPKKKLGSPPGLLIIGGSRGAQRINNVIEEVLPELLARFRLKHLTGQLDYKRFVERRKMMSKANASRYKIYGFVDPVKMANFYAQADIVISRSGANTVSEIMIVGRPAILIPIPWTQHDEQTKNAQLVKASGLGLILEEKDLTGPRLLLALEDVLKNWNKMRRKKNKDLVALDLAAASKIASLVGELA